MTRPIEQRARAAARRLLNRLAPPDTAGIEELQRRVGRQSQTIRALRRQVMELEADIDETRRLHQRVAELTDAVAELLVPAVDRDDERVRAALETFARASF